MIIAVYISLCSLRTPAEFLECRSGGYQRCVYARYLCKRIAAAAVNLCAGVGIYAFAETTRDLSFVRRRGVYMMYLCMVLYTRPDEF